MQTFIHGTSKGNAMLAALIMIMVLSTIFISLVPRIIATKRYAREYKAQVIHAIEQSNMEAMNLYDFY
jgi:competence protein ComGC